MAKCNVKKYDNLPARVGAIDVDAMRAGLHMEYKRIEKSTANARKIEEILDGLVEEGK